MSKRRDQKSMEIMGSRNKHITNNNDAKARLNQSLVPPNRSPQDRGLMPFKAAKKTCKHFWKIRHSTEDLETKWEQTFHCPHVIFKSISY